MKVETHFENASAQSRANPIYSTTDFVEQFRTIPLHLLIKMKNSTPVTVKILSIVGRHSEHEISSIWFEFGNGILML